MDMDVDDLVPIRENETLLFFKKEVGELFESPLESPLESPPEKIIYYICVGADENMSQLFPNFLDKLLCQPNIKDVKKKVLFFTGYGDEKRDSIYELIPDRINEAITNCNIEIQFLKLYFPICIPDITSGQLLIRGVIGRGYSEEDITIFSNVFSEFMDHVNSMGGCVVLVDFVKFNDYTISHENKYLNYLRKLFPIFVPRNKSEIYRQSNILLHWTWNEYHDMRKSVIISLHPDMKTIFYDNLINNNIFSDTLYINTPPIDYSDIHLYKTFGFMDNELNFDDFNIRKVKRQGGNDFKRHIINTLLIPRPYILIGDEPNVNKKKSELMTKPENNKALLSYINSEYKLSFVLDGDAILIEAKSVKGIMRGGRRRIMGRSPFRRSPFRRSPLRRSPFRRSPLRRSPLRRSPFIRSPLRSPFRRRS